MTSQALKRHALWPEATWNCSGLFVFDRVILDLLDKSRELGVAAPITSVHGAPSVLWNGGRKPAHLAHIRLQTSVVDTTISTINERGLGVFLTFSNPLIREEHLANQVCNVLLDRIARAPELNGVIVSSEVLSRYIREKYPRLTQVASIVKVACEDGTGNIDYYRSLAGRYDRVVFCPDDVYDRELLSALAGLDAAKFEILANEHTCIKHCPVRKDHYLSYAQEALDGVERGFNCIRDRGDPLYDSRRLCRLDSDEIRSFYELGFRNFKLQGRTDTGPSFIYDLLQYVIDRSIPEFNVLFQWLMTKYPGNSPAGRYKIAE